jgi:hypothetical protein
MAATIAENSKIKFKYGSQARLDDIIKGTVGSGGESGTFYLTEDTHRLYVGLDDKSIVPVNEGIVTYATLPDPVANKNLAGQFAYIEGSGVLAVHNGKQWVHLNPDTDTTYTLSGFTSKSETNLVTLTSTLTGTDSITSAASFKVKGSGGVIVSATGDTITVDGPNLTATVTNSSTFSLSVGDSTVNFKTEGNLSVRSDSGTVVLKAAADSLDGKLYDTAGKEIAKPGDLTTGFKAIAKDTAGNTSGTHIDPVIKYGKNKDQSAKFNITTGAAELDVYTKAEVDALRQGFDAMTYIGTTASTPTKGSGANNGIAKGDTWKVSSRFQVTHGDGTKTTVNAGDLIIANGTESNGAITAATLKFEVVESGNEDTQYVFTGKNYGFSLKDAPMGNAAAGAEIGSFEVVSGTDITIAGGTGNNAASGKVVAQIKHANVTRNDGTEGTGSAGYAGGYVYDTKDVVLVEDIESSATGHITKAAKKKWTIKDTHAKLLDSSVTVGVTYTTSGDESTAAAKTTVKLYHDATTYDEDFATLNIKSINPNLKVTGSGTTVQMDLVWSTF